MGTAVYFSDSGKARQSALGDSLACFDGAGCLLSLRRQRACGQQQVPTDILSKRQDGPCENRANGRGTETERKCANLMRNKGMQDESRRPVPATFCRPSRNAVWPEPAFRVSPARGMACKRTSGVCMRAGSIRDGKSFPKLCFSLLPALAGTALRQKSFVFAEGGSFLCGKRSCFYREKTTVGTEKCSIQTVFPPAF